MNSTLKNLFMYKTFNVFLCKMAGLALAAQHPARAVRCAFPAFYSQIPLDLCNTMESFLQQNA